MKRALVLGAGGFIGNHLVKRLRKDGFYVKGADITHPQFSQTEANEFILGDLRDFHFCQTLFDGPYERIYQLAADMGGAGYIFSGENDATIMSNSVQINLNILHLSRERKPGLLFFSSSACIYPDPSEPTPDMYAENTAYPALPDSDYGWEKLFSERLYEAHARNFSLDVRIARFHNIYGPEAIWQGGKEKAIAAICRKVIQATENTTIQIWGDGRQTRSFLYIDKCLEAIELLMQSSFPHPVNIGSDEMISIQALTEMTIAISGKKLSIENIKGPTGVETRTSNNTMIKKELGWAPDYPLRKGVETTYRWIESQAKQHS